MLFHKRMCIKAHSQSKQLVGSEDIWKCLLLEENFESTAHKNRDNIADTSRKLAVQKMEKVADSES